MQPDRQRTVLRAVDSVCALCGGHDIVLAESRSVRRGLSRLNPRFDDDRRRYELCQTCGAKKPLDGSPVVPGAGAPEV